VVPSRSGGRRAAADLPWPAHFDTVVPVVDEQCSPAESNVPRARHAAGAALAGRPSRADVELVVSELATNAVQHARTDFRLRVSVLPGSVLVRVDDRRRGGPFGSREASPADASGGRGLALVASLADEWGVYPRSDGTCVWAVVADR
jgi:serine/threonine-protein kinase RsbW